MKALRILALLSMASLIALKGSGQTLWFPTTPSLSTPGALSIPVNYGIDRVGTVYIIVDNFDNTTSYTSVAVKAAALAGPSGTRVATAVRPVNPGEINTILQEIMSVADAGTFHTINIVAEDFNSVLQAVPVRLTTTTLSCPQIDLLTGFTQTEVCVNKGATSTFLVVISNPPISGVLKGTTWQFDWGDGTTSTYTSISDYDLPPLALRTHIYSTLTDCNYVFTIAITNPCGHTLGVQYIAVVHGRDIPSDGDGLLRIVDNMTGNNMIQVCEGAQSVITLRDNSVWNCQNPVLPGALIPVPNSDPRNIEWLYGRDPIGAITNTITGTVSISTLGNAPQQSGRFSPVPYGPESLSQAITIPATCKAGEYFRVYLKNWNKCNWADPEFVNTYVDILVIAAPPAPVAPHRIICMGDNRTLNVVSPPVGTIYWFADPSLTNLVGTGSSYTPASVVPGVYTFWVVDRSLTGMQCQSQPTVVTLTILPVIANNSIAPAQTICYNTVPAILSGTLPAGGNGTYTYLWESSNVSPAGPWSAASGPNIFKDYIPVASLTQTTWFRRRVTSGSCSNISPTIQVTVYPVLLPGSIGSSQTICYNTTAAPLTQIMLPSGGTGSYIYQWQSSIDNVIWINIPGAIMPTYSPGAITINTSFRRRVTSGSCGSINSNTVLITVNQVALMEDKDTVVCSGETFYNGPGDLNSGYVAGTTYTWPAPAVTGGITGGTAGSGTVIIGTLNNPTNIVQTAIYTITPITGSCAGPTLTLTVSVEPSISISNFTNAICSGSVFLVTPVNGVNGIVPAGTTYSWPAPVVTGGITGGVAGFNALNIIGTLVNPTNSTQTATYTVTPYFGACSGPPFTVVVAVNPDPVPTISGPTEVGVNSIANIYTTEPGMLNYIWNVSPGGIITSGGSFADNTVTVTWNTSGAQTVSVNYTNSNNCNASSPTVYNVSVGAGFSNCGTVTDVDGNVYNTVTIGTQCWMQENLKTTKFSDGTPIPLVNSTTAWDPLTNSSIAYSWYNDDINNKDIYGALYTWTAAMNGADTSSVIPSGVQGVCPTGWHLPSWDEWAQMIKYIDPAFNMVGSSIAGGPMKEIGIIHWDSPNTGATNESGFTALPGGGRGGDGIFLLIGTNAIWWSTTRYGSGEFTRTLSVNNNNTSTQMFSTPWDCGISVRCVRNEVQSLASVSTSAITDIASYSAVSGGNIANDGGAAITARGVCWSTSANPTIAGNKTSDGTGTGVFTSTLTGLIPGTVYYVRAYATNSIGTAYGYEESFITTTFSVTLSGSGDACFGTTSSIRSEITGGTPPYTINHTRNGVAQIPFNNYISGTDINLGVLPVGNNVFALTSVVDAMGSTVPAGALPGPYSITVVPQGQVIIPPEQVVCNMEPTIPVVFTTFNTGGFATYVWTNSNPSIGLPASGNGDIPSFMAVNPGTSPNIAYITVIPYFSNGMITCEGPPQTFIITVNPTAQVNDPPDQSVFSGSMTLPVDFTTMNTGGVATYQWINDNPSIGLAATGMGNITSFTAYNPGPSPIMATITVIPYYNNGPVNCFGPAHTFTITVSSFEPGSIGTDQTICEGTAPATLITTAPPVGSGTFTYQWVGSHDGVVFFDIAAAISHTYSPPALSQDTWYKLKVTSTFGAFSETKETNQVKITVNNFDPGSIAVDQTICENTTPAPFTSISPSGEGVFTYQWQRSIDGVLFNHIVGEISETYAAGALTQDTYFRRLTTSTLNALSCTKVSNPDKITVAVISTPNASATINNSPVICNDALTDIVFHSNVPNTDFIYTVTSVPVTTWQPGKAPVSGIQVSGEGFRLAQNLAHTSTQPVTVTYTITPRGPGATACYGPSVAVAVVVNPKPTLISTLTPPAICSNTVFSYIPASSTPGTIFYWTRPTVTGIMPAGPASGTGNPNEILVNNTTAPKAVTYNYALTYNGCTNIQNVTVMVNPQPEVTTANSKVICSGMPANIVLNSNVAGTTYTWTIGPITGFITGATAGSGSTIIQTLVNPGSTQGSVVYRVIPTANSCPGVQSNITVSVDPATGTTSFTTGATEVCQDAPDETYTAVALNSLSVTYSVTPASAGIINPVTGLMNWNADFNGTATITATSAGLCGSTVANRVVTVSSFPNLIITNPAPVCDPGTADLTSSSVTSGSTAGLSYTYFTDAGATVVYPTPAAATAGIYYIKGTSAPGCFDIKPVEVTIQPGPEASAGGSQTICATASVIVNGASASNGTILWTSSGKGVLSDASTLSPTYTSVAADAGTTVTLTMTVTGNNACFPQKDSAYYTIYVKQFQAITFAALPEKAYGNNTFTLSAVASSSLAVNYTSSNNSVASISGNNITITGAGNAIIYANQPGNEYYCPAPGVSQALTVKPQSITVTVNPLQSKAYGSADPILSYTCNPSLVNGDKFTGALTRTAGENPGTYSIQKGTLNAGSNYSIASFITSYFIINKAELTASGGISERRYLEPNPVLNISYSGFVNGEDKSVLDVLPTATTVANSDSDAGLYSITVSGGSDNYYSFKYINGELNILKADQYIIFNDIPDKLRKTEQYQLEAIASSGLPVSFESDDLKKGIIEGSTLIVLKEGHNVIIARQDGNQNWNPAIPVTKSYVGQPTFDNVKSMFTPNGDGVNDYWYIPDIEDFGIIQVKVYNRFGKLVYESQYYKNDWDGSFNSAPLPSASYYYVIKSSEKGIINGVVNIVR